MDQNLQTLLTEGWAVALCVSIAGHIRISDLGLAIKLDKESRVRGRVGTTGYMGRNIARKKIRATS